MHLSIVVCVEITYGSLNLVSNCCVTSFDKYIVARLCIPRSVPLKILAVVNLSCGVDMLVLSKQ